MVFPIYDENPFRRASLPWLTWGLILVNVAIFLVETGIGEQASLVLVRHFAAIPAQVFHQVPRPFADPAELTLVTSLFLHGGWDHLLGNMIYLWVFGDDIEDALGPFRFLAFYLLAGIAASLAFCAFNPRSSVPLVGASGAISGILAAYLLLRPCAKVSVFVFRAVIRVRAYWVIGAWVAMQLAQVAMKSDDGVAYAAHLGGLVAGALLFLVMRPPGVGLFECIDTDAEKPATG